MKNAMRWLALSGLALSALLAHADTQPGDKLQMQCGNVDDIGTQEEVMQLRKRKTDSRVLDWRAK